MKTCQRCGDDFSTDHDKEHPTLCCGCYDLSLGMPLEILNRERLEEGREPLQRIDGDPS